MKVLFVGDVVGSSGRAVLAEQLPLLKEEYAIDYVIVNGENAAHGKGLTAKVYRQLLQCGVDFITMGNHTFSKNDILNFIDDVDNLVRPANLEPTHYGKSTQVVTICGKRVAITNLCGEIFMHNVIDSPFACMEDVLAEVDADLYFVDLHAEATSEKIAFLYRFAGRIHAVVGTHTHVQTADERIVNGTAAITDLGMCGAYTSVLGRDVDEIVTRFTTNQKTRYTIAQGAGIFCGLLVEFDAETNKAIAVKRIQIRPNE